MNLKKFISGVSALAIAASAFAGITAMAADPVTVSANYVDSTATDYVANADGWTADNSNVTVEWVEGTGVKMSTGKLPGTNGMSKTLDTTYVGNITGSFLWNVGTSTGKDNNYNALKVADNAGVSLFELRAHGQSGVSEIVIGDTTTNLADSSTSYTRNVDWQVNYTYNTVTGALTVKIDPDVGSKVWNLTGLTGTAANVSKFWTGWTRDGGGNSSENTVKNYSLTCEEVSIPAGGLTINFVDNNNNAVAEPVAVDVSGKNAGDNYTYAYPKYIANGGNLYKTTAEKTRATVKLTDAAQSVNAAYSVEAEGTYYVYEFDGGYTTRADYESNGSAATSSAKVTVPADGIYTVTANCYGSAGGRTGTISVGDTELVAATSISIYVPGTDLKKTDVALNAGDEITVRTSDSKSGIDYVILQKTAELPVPAANFVANVDNFGTTVGDDDNTDVASYFTVEVTNNGDAEGTFNTITVTGDGIDYAASASYTLGVNASVVYGGIINGVALSAKPTATAN